MVASRDIQWMERPSAVGHVPESPNSRKAELEALLLGNNSSATVAPMGRVGS